MIMSSKMACRHATIVAAGIALGVVALNGGPAVAGPTPDCGPNFMWDCTMPNGSHQFVDATRCEIAAFQRQTGAIATATGRVAELKAAVNARRVALDARLRGAYARYAIAAQAAEAITSTALPLIGENEQLTRESYQAGKIGLLELLVIRREGFAARRDALDAQLEATLAGIEVRGVAGVIR
jgi:outer membrane protein TolC